MREYLVNFLNEFNYEQKDASELISAYDKIVENKEAKSLLDNVLKTYEENIFCDYGELIKMAGKMAELTGLHTYTTELLIFMCMSKHTKKLYEERNIDMQIYKDSMLDLKWKLDECKLVKGICGSFVAGWFPGFFNLTRFALGRLQFEVINFWHDYEKGDIKLKKDDKVINVHIPRTGTPMDKESCDKSYAQAREFFKSEVGENCPFVCHSWLLYPENLEILPKHTNTYRFASEYDIIEWKANDGEDLWRLFDTDEKDPNKLPTNTSLRRNYVEHLKKGGKLGWGCGVRP